MRRPKPGCRSPRERRRACLLNNVGWVRAEGPQPNIDMYAIALAKCRVTRCRANRTASLVPASRVGVHGSGAARAAREEREEADVEAASERCDRVRRRGAQAGAGEPLGSVTLGKGRFFAEVSGARRRGGKSAPFGDQESISGNAHGGVMVESSPASPFEMPEPDLLLELLIVALDAPAHHGDIDHALESDVLGQRGEPEFRGLLLALRPFDDQPLLGLLAARALAGGAHTHAGEAGGEPRVGAVAPGESCARLASAGWWRDRQPCTAYRCPARPCAPASWPTPPPHRSGRAP